MSGCWLQLGDGHFIEIMAVSDCPPASHGSNWTTVSKREIWKQMSIKTRYKMLCNGEWEQLQVWSHSNKMLRYFPAWRRSAETGFWPRPFCYHLHLGFSTPRLLLTDTQSDTNYYLLPHPVDRGGIKNKNIDIKLVQTCSIWYTSECWPDFTAPTFIINQISLASATEQSLSLLQHRKQNIFSRIWNTE